MAAIQVSPTDDLVIALAQAALITSTVNGLVDSLPASSAFRTIDEQLELLRGQFEPIVPQFQLKLLLTSLLTKRYGPMAADLAFRAALEEKKKDVAAKAASQAEYTARMDKIIHQNILADAEKHRIDPTYTPKFDLPKLPTDPLNPNSSMTAPNDGLTRPLLTR
ncbi:MAG TPA: hypothetical protein VFF76_04535 [Holophagaceae bacterium]|nr:hypothetical protein [Holophagaceae bacterium]